ncbi:hypothetical protein CEP54_015850 [Fusarium duplospermum]|uniref:Uncharacterized protein n=1 Tax=Fusarium duplospermum TaxID=1325734 RepID=A0A428NKP1_9HYPO|nr:hypothetical protein CEP54_015850 [Fusarium duplospermum]
MIGTYIPLSIFRKVGKNGFQTYVAIHYGKGISHCNYILHPVMCLVYEAIGSVDLETQRASRLPRSLEERN